MFPIPMIFQPKPVRNRNDRGFTLIEMIIAISIGILITMAAASVMLLGVRLYNASAGNARHQGEVLTAITAMENMVADGKSVRAENDKILSDNTPIVSKSGSKLVNASGGTILENVQEFTVTMDGSSLLSVKMKVRGEAYSFFILATDGSVSQSSIAGMGAGKFLEILKSQIGTELDPNYGYINGDPTGMRYATWYNAAWGSEAAWCSCFVSWALEQCRGYIAGNTPRHASVNSFKTALLRTNAWQDAAADYVPTPGELVFFDWDLDGLLDHVGVVEEVVANRVHTIEGNSGGSTNANGKVQRRDYSLQSAHISGYGQINWIG